MSRRLLSGKGFSHGSVAAWTPASLGAALIAWYKADAGVYHDAGITLATNGQSVQQWNDQSGHGYHLKQAAVTKPTFLMATLNGLPVLDFNIANSQCMQTDAVVPFGVATMSGAILFKATATGSNCRVLGIATGGADTSSDTAIIVYIPGALTGLASYNGSAMSSGTIVSGSWNQVASIFDGANDTMYIGNVAQTPHATTNTFNAAVNIDVFCDGGQSSTPGGQVAEIVFTNTALNSTDRGNLNTYLFGRWGI